MRNRLLAVASAVVGATTLISPLPATAASSHAGTPSGATASAHTFSRALSPWQLKAEHARTHTTTRPTSTRTLSTAAAAVKPIVTFVVAANNPDTYGNTVQLSATVDLTKVAGGGTIKFLDAAKVVLGAVPVDSTGYATMSTTNLSAGKHSLTAVYYYAGTKSVASTALTLTVNKQSLILWANSNEWARPLNGPNPTYTVAVWPGAPFDAGLRNGDTLATAVSGKAKITIGTTTVPATVPVTLSGLSSLNYAITYHQNGLGIYSRDIRSGDVAPDFTTKDQNGNNFTLSSLRGRVVLLDLSTVWCGPSNFMATQVSTVQSDMRQRGIPFTYETGELEGPSPGVPSTQNDARHVAAHYHLGSVLHVSGVAPAIGQPLTPLYNMFLSYGYALGRNTPPDFSPGFPTLAVIDANGVVRNVHLGSEPATDLEPVIESAYPATGVTLTSIPSSPTNNPNVSIEWSAAAATTCVIDGTNIGSCASPLQIGLADGNHIVKIFAAGYTAPAVVEWFSDTTPPDTTITSGPGSGVPTFTFTSTEAGGTFQCWVDAGAPAPCSSPYVVADVPGGDHTFYVAASDALGNEDPTPAASSTFTTQPLPDINYDLNPPAPTDADPIVLTITLTDHVTSAPVTGGVLGFDPNTGTYDNAPTALDSNGQLTVTSDGQPLPPETYTIQGLYTGDASHGAATVYYQFTVTPSP